MSESPPIVTDTVRPPSLRRRGPHPGWIAALLIGASATGVVLVGLMLPDRSPQRTANSNRSAKDGSEDGSGGITAPQETAPQETAPQETAPQETAPQETLAAKIEQPTGPPQRHPSIPSDRPTSDRPEPLAPDGVPELPAPDVPIAPVDTPGEAQSEPPRHAATEATGKHIVRQGDIEVAVRWAKVGAAEVAGGFATDTLELADPDAKSLLIGLTVRNISTDRRIRFFGFEGDGAAVSSALLTDDLKGRYRRRTLRKPGVERDEPEGKPAPAKVVELTEENFRKLVLRSKKPVLVQFWADWNEASRELTPVIDYVAAEYGDAVLVGRFRVADSETEGQFKLTPVLQACRVTTIPAVLIFHQGKPVAGATNEIPLGAMEDELDRLLPEKTPQYRPIEPGASLEETLAFEPPSARAKSLQLELPGAAFGRLDSLQLQIPVTMIVTEPQ